MTKGRPWTVEEEKQLRQLLKAGKSVRAIAKILGKTRDCVRMKIARLELEVVVQESAESRTTTSSLILPEELPSVEESLRILAGALEASCKSGLDKVEVQRLQVVATLAKTYKELLADYVNYRGIEAELLELREKYAELAKKAQSATTQ